MVPHRSTNLTRRCLTSLSGREAVLSSWYGRSCMLDVQLNYNFVWCEIQTTRENDVVPHRRVNEMMQHEKAMGKQRDEMIILKSLFNNQNYLAYHSFGLVCRSSGTKGTTTRSSTIVLCQHKNSGPSDVHHL